MRRPASRTASASASRSSRLGGAGENSGVSRTTSHPRGAVRRSACSTHRSYECGSACCASGPSTAVESAYT